MKDQKLVNALVNTSIAKHTYDLKPLVPADLQTPEDWHPEKSNKLDAAWVVACENYIKGKHASIKSRISARVLQPTQEGTSR